MAALLAAVTLCAACAAGVADSSPAASAGDASSSSEAGVFDAPSTPDGSGVALETGTGDDGATEPDSLSTDASSVPTGDDGAAQDSSTVQSDAGSGSPDSPSSSPESGPTGDSMAPDTGSAPDTGPPRHRRAGHGDQRCFDVLGRPAPSYQNSCTSCTVSPTCLLSCSSCTKRDQSQNPNPSVQLPCPGTMSVENNDGSLLCN